MQGARQSQELPVGELLCPEPDVRPDLWPWSAQREEGELTLGGIGASTLASTWGTPLFVCDLADVRGRARVWADAMAEEFWDGYGFAGGDAYYAGKAFLCAQMARLVSEQGMGVDTASPGELACTLRAGVAPEQVGLHGNNKLDQEIEWALAPEQLTASATPDTPSHQSTTIHRIFIDSQDEVTQVERIAARLGVVAPVMVRVKCGIHAGGNEYIATAHEDQKFGVSLADGQADRVIDAVVASPHLRFLGLHSHIGSQIEGTEAFVQAARILVQYMADLRGRGIEVHQLDLGGGVGIAYSGRDPQSTSPRDVAAALAHAVREGCEHHGVPVPHVSVEPGRSVVGPTMITLYRVGVVKEVTLEDGATRTYVSIDGGMSDNIRPALYGANYTATLANRVSAEAPRRCRIVGKHCESGDVVVHDVDLPGDIRRGDLLAVPATGAYGWSMASNYNMMLRPGVLGVENGEAAWMVRPQTLDDLNACDPILSGSGLPQ